MGMRGIYVLRGSYGQGAEASAPICIIWLHKLNLGVIQEGRQQFQKQTSTSQELGLKGKWDINRGRMGSLLSGMLAVVPGA